MRKFSILLAAAVLTLQNSGARADALGHTDILALPQPALVTSLAIMGMACLLLLAHAPIATAPKGPKSNWIWRATPSFWPSRRATLAIFAVVTVGGALGMA